MPCIYKLLCSFFIVLCSTHTYAQRFVVTNNSQKALYVGVENPLSVIVDGLDCDRIIMKTNNGTVGKLERKGTACVCTIKPAEKSTAIIQLFKKENKTIKKIGESHFWVEAIPLPKAMVGNIATDTVSKKIFIAMGGIRAIIMNSLFCSEAFVFSVVSYNAIMMRNDSVLTVIHNTGARYNTELVADLRLLQKGDQVIFSNVSVQYYDKSVVVLKPVSYTITE